MKRIALALLLFTSPALASEIDDAIVCATSQTAAKAGYFEMWSNEKLIERGCALAEVSNRRSLEACSDAMNRLTETLRKRLGSSGMQGLNVTCPQGRVFRIETVAPPVN